MKEITLERLRSIQLFSSLQKDDIAELKDALKIKRFKKNEVILFEEDTNEYMYAILSGRVKVFRSTEDGKEIILAVHREGEFFGEMSLIDRKTSPATVVALTDSVIALLSRRDFFKLIRNQTALLEQLLQILCGRLRDAWQKMEMLNFKNAAQRVKILLLMLIKDHGKEQTSGDILLDIKLTHQDIADMTGLTRETVTRVLDRWQKDQEIEVKK
ncbi:MAG: Crp/Fnr family transcriptional regulator, partial [Nitrospirae bacterium]